MKTQEYLTYNLIEALYWGKVFEVIRVGNLARGPLALVGGIVNQWSVPLALIKRIRLVWAANKSIRVGNSNDKGYMLPLPLAATRSFVALGV
jgi:hypothetical protein